MSEIWTEFEHCVWKQFLENELDSKNKFILAVSGGLDSMLLLEVFLRLKPNAEIVIAYFHHGTSENKTQEKFRDECLEMVKHKISVLGRSNVVFRSERSNLILVSEDEMRKSRWRFLRSLKSSDEVLVTAHHLDDRLETMLLKMIRGTALDGFLAFRMWNQEIFRPLLGFSKPELLDYAQKLKLDWLEDPSNSEEVYLRNWLRENWLKELDAKVESGSKNLAKSLLKISEAANENQSFELEFEIIEGSFVLKRQWYVSLSKSDQLRALAQFLKKHQIHSFTNGQLEEIRKRLDNNQKDITFMIVGKKWVINASYIVLQ